MLHALDAKMNSSLKSLEHLVSAPSSRSIARADEVIVDAQGRRVGAQNRCTSPPIFRTEMIDSQGWPQLFPRIGLGSVSVPNRTPSSSGLSAGSLVNVEHTEHSSMIEPAHDHTATGI